LGVVIPEVTPTFDVPVNDYDGKITYGEKKSGKGFKAEYHTEQLSSSVEQLAKLEKAAQSSFIKMKTGSKQWLL
jgi:ATP-dependent RNA helicase DDX1